MSGNDAIAEIPLTIHCRLEGRLVALTWSTLFIGGGIMFGLPIAIILFNQWRRNAGWWLLVGFVIFIVLGNLADTLLTRRPPLF